MDEEFYPVKCICEPPGAIVASPARWSSAPRLSSVKTCSPQPVVSTRDSRASHSLRLDIIKSGGQCGSGGTLGGSVLTKAGACHDLTYLFSYTYVGDGDNTPFSKHLSGRRKINHLFSNTCEFRKRRMKRPQRAATLKDPRDRGRETEPGVALAGAAPGFESRFVFKAIQRFSH